MIHILPFNLQSRQKTFVSFSINIFPWMRKSLLFAHQPTGTFKISGESTPPWTMTRLKPLPLHLSTPNWTTAIRSALICLPTNLLGYNAYKTTSPVLFVVSPKSVTLHPIFSRSTGSKICSAFIINSVPLPTLSSNTRNQSTFSHSSISSHSARQFHALFITYHTPTPIYC